ncbi:carboxypeptidase regulatory-like domain-containing protein [Dehalobacter sp. DCM]|uniref:4Fe-4S dicluster domain-containing protein n=1 Tax=Dehalobacter sp. DCM TaxID=2907827 RepID=UPI003081FA43|nr:carboxypeptidase regulatory-like domain-containing protein [Dehalobacter sp. DCM]
MKVFVIDMAKCNGCYGCQLACKDEHVNNDWMPYAKPQPDTGHFWMRIEETVHGQVPKVKLEYRPVSCMHCDKPACIEAGNGAVYKREDGLVIIDPVKAEGNKELVNACPYHTIYWNEELNVAQKCTGCAHLVDEGKLPRCADFCATGALRFGEEADFAAEIASAEVLSPEFGQKPRVYYLNLPKLFIGGDVWDRADNEIIENAVVTLKGENGCEVSVKTDDFGDFWFKKLSAGNYSLTIEADGYKSVSVDHIRLEKSLNLGDFPLEK